MRYLFVSGISYASRYLSYRSRNILHGVLYAPIADYIDSPLGVVNVAALKGRRGVEIDFARLARGTVDRVTRQLLSVFIVGTANVLYQFGWDVRISQRSANACCGVHEEVQVEIYILFYGVPAQSGHGCKRACLLPQPYLQWLLVGSNNSCDRHIL